MPSFLENQVIAAMKAAHPYEEVAFEVIALSNKHPETGAGITGYLPEEMDEKEFLDKVKSVFKVPVVKHTRLTGKKVKKIAICGGAGNFLISKALATDSQAYITSDLKYHEYFDADNRILLIDVGHYESEQFTIDYLSEVLGKKFPNFAVLKTELITNPVHYFF